MHSQVAQKLNADLLDLDLRTAVIALQAGPRQGTEMQDGDMATQVRSLESRSHSAYPGCYVVLMTTAAPPLTSYAMQPSGYSCYGGRYCLRSSVCCPQPRTFCMLHAVAVGRQSTGQGCPNLPPKKGSLIDRTASREVYDPDATLDGKCRSSTSLFQHSLPIMNASLRHRGA